LAARFNEMNHIATYQENIPELIVDSARLAVERCGACQNMHVLWPMLRQSRVVSGIEGGAHDLSAAIATACAGGRKRILIAGAADTGTLCLAANASAQHGAEFTIIDICDTPLELCRRFAQRFGLRVHTLVADVHDLTFRREFDIVIAHSLLQFIPEQSRLTAYQRLADALASGGVIIQVFNAGARIEGQTASEHRKHYPEWVMSQFMQAGIELPEPYDTVYARLETYARDRERREGAVPDFQTVNSLMQEAGLSVVDCREIDLNVMGTYGEFLSKLSKRRYLSVARLAAPR
jgi:ubiquinone/menaquinone biosynthesis C-methylase UbiE